MRESRDKIVDEALDEVVDDVGRTVTLKRPVRRILSLCPSITETLFALGLDEQIVGVTRYCLHPADKVRQKPDIGGTKKFRHEDVNSLEPDLIIAEKEENRPEDVEALAARFPVYVADVVDYPSALKMIADLGALCDCAAAAEKMTADIQSRFQALPKLARALRVAYMIWRKPYMCVAADTYIDDMLSRCGFANVFRRHACGSRYPEVTSQELRDANLDAVLLSSEPFPFTEKHTDEFAQMLPDVAIRLVDGEAFSWYGVRMSYAAAYLGELVTELEETRR